MAKKKGRAIGRVETISELVTLWTGTTRAFASAVGVIIVWAALGPVFRFSDTWQLVINTGTTIVTFLMVFLIQRAQNKDAQAVHLKLNEVIAAIGGASNRLVNVETLPEDELRRLHARFSRLLELAEREGRPSASHSVEETAAAEDR